MADVEQGPGRRIAPAIAYVGPERRGSRAEAIASAIRDQIRERTAMLDKAEDLGEVSITIKLQAGTSWVRSVTWQEERLCRQRK